MTGASKLDPGPDLDMEMLTEDPIEVALVEDSDDWAELVGDSLKLRMPGRYQLRRFSTVTSCIESLRLSPAGCILLDLSLPDADGMEGVDALQLEVPGVPLVVLTGMDDDARAVEAVRRGAQDYLVKQRFDVDDLARSIQHAIQRKRVESELAREAFYDPLTKLPNRRLLMDRLSVACARLERKPDASIAVLFIDLDRFKAVNDEMGHDAGDRLLVATGDRINRTMRPSDTTARIGGDEFVVLCEELRSPADSDRIAERVAQAIAEPLFIDGQELHPTASIGVAVAAGPGAVPEALLGEADSEMYRAKRRNDSRGAPPAPEPAQRGMRGIMADLRDAVERHELSVAFQPIIRLEDREAVGVEALVRWHGTAGELLTPARLIPMAEAGGFMADLDREVIAEAITQVARWNREFRAPAARLGCSVNCSGATIADPTFPGFLGRTLDRNGLVPELLTIEITEDAPLDDAGIERIAEIKATGARVALDDFGAGFSSYASLASTPLDELKLDRSLIAGLDGDPRLTAIVRAALALGTDLGLSVVAEGVETEAEAAQLRGLGFELAQGFLFGRPEFATNIRGLTWPSGGGPTGSPV
ncbi:MAG: hypothetical protein QOG62_1311 [Thermoleophilaceae bacterium]|jgi:diguanylate cyclase (GGDEF)-like protein|nr:hypothetical protein [Thermoleophilaceae bacterium]